MCSIKSKQKTTSNSLSLIGSLSAEAQITFNPLFFANSKPISSVSTTVIIRLGNILFKRYEIYPSYPPISRIVELPLISCFRIFFKLCHLNNVPGLISFV